VVKRVLAAAESVAAYAIVVDATDEGGRRFYESHGFILFRRGPIASSSSPRPQRQRWQQRPNRKKASDEEQTERGAPPRRSRDHIPAGGLAYLRA
jgi:hypothetical protein